MPGRMRHLTGPPIGAPRISNRRFAMRFRRRRLRSRLRRGRVSFRRRRTTNRRRRRLLVIGQRF